MCGRQRCGLQEEECVAAAQAIATHGQTEYKGTWIDRNAYSPSDNVSPGFSTPVVHAAEQDEASAGLTLHTMRWGLVPSFTKKDAKPDFWRMFNARSEGLAANNVFRRLVTGRRCVVLSQGFYEWHKEHKAKQPYYIHLDGHELLFFAGLYDAWTDADGTRLHSYTIVTTSSSPRLEWLHDRMPVLLRTEEACARWLRGPFDEVGKLLRPYEAEDLVCYRVTPAINRAGYRGDDCWKPVKQPTMASFFGKPGVGPGPKPETVNADEEPGERPPVKDDDAGSGEVKAKGGEVTLASVPVAGVKVDGEGPETVATTPHDGATKAHAQKRGQTAIAAKSPAKKSKRSTSSDNQPGQSTMLAFLKKK